MHLKSIGKDHIGAAICVALGVGTLGLGLSYHVGTLQSMGAGFMPVAIGALLILVGVAIAMTAAPRSAERPSVDAHRPDPSSRPEWRGWLCIVGGIVAFVVVGRWGGLVPASYFSVFIAALGDREGSVKGSAILAAVVTVFGVLVFYYFLSLQMPLFQWG